MEIKTDIRTGFHPDIRWYIIHDTNWLLSQPPSEHVIYPGRRTSVNQFEIFAVRLILPLQVKAELLSLKNRGHDHREIANARRWLPSFYSLTHKTWQKSVIIQDIDGVLEEFYSDPTKPPNPAYFELVSGLPLLSYAEVDLLDIPERRTSEGSFGADSLTDRQLISLARHILELHQNTHCFISSLDTGVQAEVAAQFYLRGQSIGCPSNIGDYMKSWEKTYELMT